MNGQVAGYRGLAESLAQKFVGRNGAELDDLVQEGLVNVWQTLRRGVTPSASLIERRMQDWTRLLGYQTGAYLPKLDDNGRPVPVDYPVLLPLDDFTNLSSDPVPSHELFP